MRYKLIIGMAVSLIVSCVPARKFQELEGINSKLDKDMDFLKSENSDLAERNMDLSLKLEDELRKGSSLKKDTSFMGNTLRMLEHKCTELNKINNQLSDNYEKLLQGSEIETQKLIKQLQDAHLAAQTREDELLELNRKVQNKEQTLNDLKDKLIRSEKELALRERKVNELERLINQKDSLASALKNKVLAALTGFSESDLNVVQKGGKVYVSLESELLFPSGSTVIDTRGQGALQKLSRVLELNKDINVMIEGHTDIDKVMSGASYKDNWDLSALRATSVVRLLLESGKIAPSRLSVSGKGEYAPIDGANTPEAKKKNRRTEIILSPKLDELYELLDVSL